jgi:hypothetical protein
MRPDRLVRQAVQVRAGEAKDGPLVHGPRAERAVEADGGLVPVQHPPFQPPAAALARQPGQVPQQRAPRAAPARLRADVQVLQVDPGLRQERRIVVEEERETQRLVRILRDHHLRRRPCAEQRLAQPVLRRDHLVQQPLVLRQLADEAQDERHVVRRGGADDHRPSSIVRSDLKARAAPIPANEFAAAAT